MLLGGDALFDIFISMLGCDGIGVDDYIKSWWWHRVARHRRNLMHLVRLDVAVQY
jgi:hypothetical protein